MQEALGLSPSTDELGMVAHVCNPRAQETEAEVQGHPWPCSELEVHLGYIRLYLLLNKLWRPGNISTLTKGQGDEACL